MDDNLSISSSESVTTSGEYEIVAGVVGSLIGDGDGDGDISLVPQANAILTRQSSGVNLPLQPKPQSQLATAATSPQLNIANNGNLREMVENLDEVIHELEATDKKVMNNQMDEPLKAKTITTTVAAATAERATSSRFVEVKNIPLSVDDDIGTPKLGAPIVAAATAITTVTTEPNKVGQSVFYDCLDMSPTTEKQDDMKPERSDTEEDMSDIDQDCTVFSGVTYLGAATINAPKSETEIQRNMSELNACSNAVGLRVCVSIPTCSEGLVVLHDATNNAVVAHYEVNSILFYARGVVGGPDQACFAFTWSHGTTAETTVFQCHVFRCQIPEAVAQVSTCFAKAFHRIPQSLTASITSAVDTSIMLASISSDIALLPFTSAEYEFIVSLEIKEKVAKNSFAIVRRDRSCFKLRCNTDKEVCITVKQQANASDQLPPLYIERCFGVLLSPGKLVRQADMQLLDMVSMGYKLEQPNAVAAAAGGTPTPLYQIRAEWKATDKAFEQLNLESQKMNLTVAVDLVIKGIQEPVRFVIETFVVIQAHNDLRIMEAFSSSKRAALVQRFYLQLKQNGDSMWEVTSINPSEEIVETAANTGTAQLSSSSSSMLVKLGTNISRMVRSTSVASIEDDTTPTDYSSDGEPLLSGTGEVSKECPQDLLDEWGPIIREWGDTKRPKNIGTMVWSGVPEALRGTVWQKLAGIENHIDITEKYRVLITKETNCETVIQRDINRTYPAHEFFRETGGNGQEALYKVSKAYAVYDSEVGYCQGLSFIAASLLLHMPEEEAFGVLVALMYEYRLRDMYKHGFKSLYLRLYQLDRLMKDQLPKLYEHFLCVGVETHMFASQWFLTLFTARFPLYFVFHILDVFLLDGIPILFQVALTLLSVCESELRQLDFEGILKYFRVTLPKKCRSASQARKVMRLACERKVKKLRQFEAEFQAEKEVSKRLESERTQFESSDEWKRMHAYIGQLQAKVNEVQEVAKDAEKKSAGIILGYKQIIQRQEQQIAKQNDTMDELTKTMSACPTCTANIKSDSPLHKAVDSVPPGPTDPLLCAEQRVRELELELAQAKLAQVEAECHNQDLNHQLNTTLAEIQGNRGSWQPWLSKTLNSIQEKITTRRDVATFQSYTGAPHPSPSECVGNESPTRTRLSQRHSINRSSCDFGHVNESAESSLNDALRCNSLK